MEIKKETKFNFFKKPFFLLATGFFCIVVFANRAQGAELKLEIQSEYLNLNEEAEVQIAIDTNNQKISVLEGELVFDPLVFEFKGISQANSIISYWVDSPVINDAGKIYFSGAVSSGYSGEKGIIFSVVFQPLLEGKTSLKIENARVFLYNESAEEIKSVSVPRELFISKNLKELPASGQEAIFKKIKLEDNNPPEDFSPYVAKDEELFEGRWFLVFEARDKESGVDFYQVQETKNSRPEENKWVKVDRAPYLLKDQSLKSNIFVKATDKASNEKLSFLPAPENFWNTKKIFVLAGLTFILLTIVGTIKVKRFLRKNEKKNKN